MEYPIINPIAGGYKVHTSKGASLPGIYLSVGDAEKAIKKYKSKVEAYKRNRSK
jgi:hypothetical protein